MPHPVLEEIVRTKLPVRDDVVTRWQRAIRDEVLPALIEREASAKKPAKVSA